MRRMLSALLGIGACVGSTDVDSTEPPVGPPADVYAQLFEGGVVSCEAPARRDEQPFDVQLLPEQPMTAANLSGGGVLVEDLDADGWMDLFVPSDHSAQLYFGSPDGFVRADARLAGLPLGTSVGATAVDFDGDGDLDIFVTRWLQPNTLLRNDGNRVFVDVSQQAFGSGAPALRSQSASWGDYDGDGDLDLFVGSYGEWAEIDVLDPVPDCSDHVADPAELWRNEGDGTFTNVSSELPKEVHEGYSFMSGFYDIYGDGFPELFSAHDDGLCAQSVMLDNQGGVFTVDLDTNFHPNSHDMGMGVGDLNGDEVPDFLLTTWNGLAYAQSSVADDGRVRWIDYSDSVGLIVDAADPQNPARAQDGQQVYGWGAEFGDIDNDGDLDAAMVFGFWSVFDGAGDPRRQNDGLWINDGGSFSDQGAAFGLAEPGMSRSVVLADVDNDGWLDVVKRILDDDTPVHVSRCGSAGWLRVRLQHPGPNTHAVGAKVRITAGGQSQIRWIQSGSAGMYSGSPLEAHFGVGDLDRIDKLEVIWPDGRISAFDDVASRQRVTVIRQAERR